MALLTTVQVCRKLGIPRSTLYYMLRSGVLEAPEKSGALGLKLLENFAAMTRGKGGM